MEQIPFPNKKYQIIYADPPWLYSNPQDDNPGRGGKQYPQMSMDDLVSLPIQSIADTDCALFMWATMPKLREAMELIKQWGFTYTTCAFTWVKQNPSGNGIYSGLGYWTNGNAELCLFAKKGKPKRVNKNVKQIVISPVGRHSKKPDEVRTRIIELVGNLPRIELFARQKTEGWDVWGNEVFGY